MLIFQKSMFDRYCIKKKKKKKKKNILSLENFIENASIIFPVPLMARKGTLPANILKTPLPRQRRKSS